MIGHALPGGFVLTYDYYTQAYKLYHSKINVAYALVDPCSFSSNDEWVTYVERAANVAPGTFSTLLTGVPYNGQHRTTSAPLYSSSPQGSGTSSGGANACTPAEAQRLTDEAVNAGYVPATQASAYYYALMQGTPPLTHPNLGSSGALGANGQQAHLVNQQQGLQGTVYYFNAATAAAVTTGYSATAWGGGGGTGIAFGGGGGGVGISGPPHKPTTLKTAEVKVGEIIAWRAWNIRGDQLFSVVAAGKPWSPTEPMQGDPAAGYGVHAYKGPHGPVLDSYVTSSSPELWVIGEVALWGDIIEHEDGYRAEFARVHSLVTWHERVSIKDRARITKKYLSDAPMHKIDDAA